MYDLEVKRDVGGSRPLVVGCFGRECFHDEKF